MNRFFQERWPWIEGSHGMRDGLLDNLSNADLEFTPGGKNMTLGALCREMGEIEYSYLQSLKTFQQSWDYHNPEAGLDRSVAQLKAWFQTLDAELKPLVEEMTDEDFKKVVNRPGGYQMPLELQLDVYLQSLLIFFGKATIFLKAMNKPLPPSFQDYIW